MSTPATAPEPRSITTLTRALRLGQHVLFAGLLVVAWGRGAGGQPGVEVVAAGLGLLYVGLVVAESRGSRTATYAVCFLLLAGWSASLLLTPDFAWLAFPLFFVVLRLVPDRAALVVVALMVLAVIWSQARVDGWSDVGLATVIGPSVGALVCIGMARTYRMLLRENAARQALLDELTAAQADLEATHAQLAESRREAGTLEERARLSRDTHDTLAQGLSSIVLLSRAAAAPGADVPTLVLRIEAAAQTSLGDAREVTGDLTPTGLAPSGFAAALERLVANVSEHSGIRATFDEEGTGRTLPRPHEVALLRLAQGALANVASHSDADRVAVSLSIVEDGTHLDIVDDGIGFDPNVVGPREDGSGYGLRSMRERVAALGGELTIESTPGHGTAIAARLPAAGSPGASIAGSSGEARYEA